MQTRSTAGSVCNWLRCREPQLVKLIRESDLSLGLRANSRMYYEPSAPRRIPFYWTQIGGFISALCLSLIFILKESAEWLMGIVFGGCGKRSDFSCRGGDIEACSPFGAWDSKETPLLYQPLRTHVVVVLHGEPDAGDNGNARELTVMIARGTNALDHSFVHAQCVVWGLLTRCGKKANWIVLLSRWRFSLCIQGKKMDFQEEKSLEAASSGRADISRGDTHSSEPVSRSPRSYYVTTNDHVSPALPYSLSYPRKRRSLPVCFPHENSRPFVQLSSCPPTFDQGPSVPDGLQRSRNVSQSSNLFSHAKWYVVQLLPNFRLSIPFDDVMSPGLCCKSSLRPATKRLEFCFNMCFDTKDPIRILPAILPKGSEYQPRLVSLSICCEALAKFLF